MRTKTTNKYSKIWRRWRRREFEWGGGGGGEGRKNRTNNLVSDTLLLLFLCRRIDSRISGTGHQLCRRLAQWIIKFSQIRAFAVLPKSGWVNLSPARRLSEVWKRILHRINKSLNWCPTIRLLKSMRNEQRLHKYKSHSCSMSRRERRDWCEADPTLSASRCVRNANSRRNVGSSRNVWKIIDNESALERGRESFIGSVHIHWGHRMRFPPFSPAIVGMSGLDFQFRMKISDHR